MEISSCERNKENMFSDCADYYVQSNIKSLWFVGASLMQENVGGLLF